MALGPTDKVPIRLTIPTINLFLAAIGLLGQVMQDDIGAQVAAYEREQERAQQPPMPNGEDWQPSFMQPQQAERGE